MIGNNRELRNGCIAMAAASTILTVVGFCIGIPCGLLVLVACGVCTFIHIRTERKRYRRLQKLSAALDELLVEGKTITIRDYEEGELSILANQLQKLLLRLTENNEIVKEDKRMLAESLADISHQLRTPLTAMNLTTTLLRAPELTDKQRLELTAELRGLLAHTDWLVETLLKISKLDAGTVLMKKERVAVAELIERAAGPLAIAMDIHDQHLIVHCGKETFSGDLVWGAEALGNILKNCTEHTPSGGRITITAEQTPLFTQICVEDSGTGFNEKDIPHLFERFYKGSNASENSYGIGLALAKTIITAQNGTVQACNGEKGAKFVIKFYEQTV